MAISNKQATYILELPAAPVAAVDAASRAAGNGPLGLVRKDRITQNLKVAQARVARVAERLGGKVTERYQGVYDGISVTLPQRDAWKLGRISGVKAVFATKTYKPADTSTTTSTVLDSTAAPGDGIPLTDAPAAWGTGDDGAGIKIADIDTGIDYTHADFGGSGNPADYQCALAHDTADPSTVTCNGTPVSNWYGPSAPKVKGGTDLVGDAYNASGSGAALTPHPDNNPLDCNSHGTHTAGTLAGFGVTSDGHEYTGSYNANTISNNSFSVPPGMAPGASLYAVRVFGCSGSVDDSVLIAAMNWAYNNGMDVVNMSLGAPFGSADDPDSVAAANLAAEGVITVVASGNNGPNPYITSSPAAGTGALSVAAEDSTQSYPAASMALTKADSTSGGSLTAIDANGASLPSGPLHILVIPTTSHDQSLGDTDTISLGCSVADDEAANGGNPLPANTVIVVERGTCARVAKAIFGQQAGAAAVIMVNNSTAFPPYEGTITSDPDPAGPPLFGGFAYTVTIPFLGVTGASKPSTSNSAKALVAANGGTLTLTGTTIANPTYLDLASFSSFGPAPGGAIKPEVAAPGVSIASAGMGTGNGVLIDSGTSMATPHTAGEAALVKAAHPGWTVQQYKDAISNTANTAGVANFSVRGAGAGLIDAYNATQTQVVADGSPAGTSSLSFGIPEITSNYTATKNVLVQNTSNVTQVFAATSTLDSGVATVTINPSTITLAPHTSATVSVTLQVSLANATDPESAFGNWWNDGQFSDVSGLVTFTPSNGSNSGIALNVPFYAVPTSVSNIRAAGVSTGRLKNGSTDDVTVINNGGGATGYADWFSWGGSSPVSNVDIGSADLTADGVQSFPSSGFLEFGLAVTKPWTNPAEDYFEIDVDVNNDGTPDYAVLSDDFGAFTTGTANGEPVVIVYDLKTGKFSIDFLSGAMFNGTTLELPVLFSQLCQANSPCLTSGNGTITYSTFSQDRNGGQDEIVNNAPYNVKTPSLSNDGEDVVAPGTKATDPTQISPSAWAADPQLGILMLAQNNQSPDNSAQTEAFTYPLELSH